MWVLKTEGSATSILQYTLFAGEWYGGELNQASGKALLSFGACASTAKPSACPCVCVCACMRACVRVGVRVHLRTRASAQRRGLWCVLPPLRRLDAELICASTPGEHEIGRSGPKPENAGCDGWITFPGVDKSISRNHAVSDFPLPAFACCSMGAGHEHTFWRSRMVCLQKIKVKPLGDPQAMEQVLVHAPHVIFRAPESPLRDRTRLTRATAARGHVQRQSICIRDRSKFGVSIDDVDECYRDKGGRATQSSQKSVHQIQKDKDVPLKQGCTITIGVNNSRLRLEWEEFVVCHSLLPKDQVSSLANTCAQLGVHLSKSWSDRVRVLVMDQIQMTPKVLLALIDQKDIVTSAYLVAIRKRANIGDPLPDPSANGVVWEFVNNNIWRHRITGDTQVV